MSAAVGGVSSPHGHSDSVNGRNPTIPAIPAVNGNVSLPDHNRKPSMTVTPAGTTGFAANGGAPGPQTKPAIQFGAIGMSNPAGSPAMGTPPSLAHQNAANLSVSQLNPRASSPSNSPSPIPQPVGVSGGRPPQTFNSQGNGYTFGQMHGEHSDPSVRSIAKTSIQADTALQGMTRPVPIQFGPPDHMRRNSSQSVHSDAGGPGLPPAGPNSHRGNFPGRGRGSYNPYPHQNAPFPPQQQYRPGSNNRPFQPGYSGRGQGAPYPGSPAMGTRSPALMNAQPGTPVGGQAHMVQPGMQPPNGYHNMGPQYVKSHPPFPSSRDPAREPARERGKPTRGRNRGGGRGGRGKGPGRGGHEEGSTTFSRDPASNRYRPDLARPQPVQVAPELVQAPTQVFPNAPMPFPDLSPESGNFERFQEHVLTLRAQGYPMTQADPSIQQMYMQQMQMYGPQTMQGQFNPPYGIQPQSPRPPYNQSMYAPNMQPSYSNQGGPPVSMSRQSSQISAPDRPGSSVGQQAPSTPAPAGPQHNASRTPSISAPKTSFTVPPKKSAAITIKNTAGEVVSFTKPPASPATSTPISATVPPVSAPTPPSRTTSAADNNHGRTESVSAKSAEEVKKSWQEAVAKKIAEDEARSRVEKETAEKVEPNRDVADAPAKIDVVEEEEVEKTEAPKQAETTAETEVENTPEHPEEAAAETTKADEDEIDYDALAAEMEAEEAAREVEELRLEEEYKKRKAAQREAEQKKAKEEAAAYEANMKELERKAEELELAREKEKAEGGSGDDDSKKMFAELKPNPFGTPASGESPAAVTPVESGTATPVSDASMPPPAAKAPGRRAKAAELTLDTKKPVEPPEPSATLKALQSAKKLENISKVVYPSDIASPNPALNANAPADRGFKYNKEFLLQFQSVFKEKPTLDWDARIREALGDGETSARPSASARTPSGMGNRSASSRGPGPMNFGPMGNFGNMNNRTPLQPGSTSEQRFAASNAALRSGAMTVNPFAQFGRPGGQMAPPMGRTPSNNPLGPMPGSPRVGGASRGGSRAESKRSKHTAKQAAEENKSMPLTAGMNIGSLEVSATGWKPRSLGQPMVSGPAPGGDGLMDPEMVQRKTKSLLNKMTPEKFDKISDQILEISGQSKHEKDGRTLRQVIQLTFEKATDEAHWAGMYAQFCRRMLESMSADIRDEGIKDKNGNVVTGGNLFRKYLLNRCQEEFERGWKVNLPPRPEGQNEETVMLSDEYYIAAAAKRRGLGLVKFIGELFKLQMLTERIMHECVKKLVDYEGIPDEAEIESLTSLLQTVGKQLDNPESKAQGRMDLYFERIKQMIELPELPSRLRFMLMDVIDLRSKGWSSKADNKGPKTITEIREEAERQAREDELRRLAAQNNRGGGGGRMPMGRGDARNFSGYGQVPPPDNSNRVGTDDLRRLGRNTRNPSHTGPGSLGPPSLMGGRTNSGRRGLGPGGLLARGDDSATSSRTGTPPAQKDKEKKDESNTNAFR